MSLKLKDHGKADGNKTTFCVVYDGPDHKNHEMNVMTLGRALTSLGSVLYEANHLLNGDRASIKVEVNADFIEGSFGFEVVLTQLLLNATDILQVLGFAAGAGAGTGTVVGALKALKGRDITSVETTDGEEAKIIVDGDEITAPEDVTKLVTNKTFRAAMEGLISAPLKNPGTTSFSIKGSPEAEAAAILKIQKREEESFAPLSVEIKEKSNTHEKRVKFIAADIKKTNGWRVEMDGKVRTVQMEDELFKERLSNMEEPHIFGKTFIVRMKIKETRRLGKARFAYTITRVQHETYASGRE